MWVCMCVGFFWCFLLVCFVSLFVVSEKEVGVVAIHLLIEPFQYPLHVGTGTEIRTRYLPAHWPMT